MDTIRKPFQGVCNIVRFNWHFYVVGYGLSAAFLMVNNFFPSISTHLTILPAFVILFLLHISLMVSLYVYDISGLYSLNWLDKSGLKLNNKPSAIVNINAGFDETSELLGKKYPDAQLSVLDFYNPEKHTEVSIKRARKAYPPYPGTLTISTNNIPIADQSIDAVFAILSAHEIRDETERIIFFKELNRILKPEGHIVVVEHLRDMPNFMAYTIGFFHFHSKRTWSNTFLSSKLAVCKTLKLTPFINVNILQTYAT